MKYVLSLCSVLGILLSCLATTAAPLAVGDAIPAITAKDQHGAAYAFTNGTPHLLVAVEMDAAKAANQKLTEQGAGFLEKHGAVYLMDIHPMPGIAKVFALPKMRKYPHRIVLIETKGVLNWAPTKAGHVSVLSLTPDGKVSKIAYWNPTTDSASSLFK
jgi:hypothetical protein